MKKNEKKQSERKNHLQSTIEIAIRLVNLFLHILDFLM